MKALKAVAVMLLGMALAAPVWGHSGGHPEPAEEVTFTCTGRTVALGWRVLNSHVYAINDGLREHEHVHGKRYMMVVYQVLPSSTEVFAHYIDFNPESQSGSYTFQGQWGGLYRLGTSHDGVPVFRGGHVPQYGPYWDAEATCGDAPTTIRPTEAASCDHAVFVPIIPPGVRGVPDSSSTAHWIRVTNPSDEPVRFKVTGFDDAGKRLGTYSSKLASRALTRIKVRELEAGFGDGSFPSWYSLDVLASGPISVVAVWKPANESHGRIVLPVERPAECPARLE